MRKAQRGNAVRPTVTLIPIIAGLLPAAAALSAWKFSVTFGLIPSCNPFLDGCVSISQAARHGLPNLIFKALVLPGATLQALTWLLCAQWLRCLNSTAGHGPAAIAVLGVLAGAFFVLYGTFLGTEGPTYQWLRRYGINFYFSFTYLCMLLSSIQVYRLSRGGWLRLPWHLDRGLGALALLVLVLGITHVVSKAVMVDETLVDHLENSLEWIVSAIFTLYFVVLAWLWRITNFKLRASCTT